MIELFTEADHARDNQATYHRMKPAIDAGYPKDWFVGIHQGQIIADAETFDAVDARIRGMGLNVREAFVVQAGENEEALGIL